MKQLDIELIRYEKLKHVKFLVNRIQHRQEHIHNEFEFFVVLRGEGVAKIKSHTYEIKEGDVYTALLEGVVQTGLCHTR